MLHERTVPLVGHDAVAVRDQSDTVVFYAERLTRAQRRFLRTHILSIIGDDGPSTVIKVPAGVAASALERRPEMRRGHPHLPLTFTALVLSAAAALVAALLVAAAVVLLADVEYGDLTAARLPGPSPSAARQPIRLAEPPPPVVVPSGTSPTDRREAGPTRASGPTEVPVVAQGLPPPGLLAVPPTSPPGVPPRPAVVPSPSKQPSEGKDGAEGRRPVPGDPPVELPDVPGPPEVPDDRPEVPDVEAPDPDVDLPDPPGGGVPGGPSDSRPDPGGDNSEPGRDDDDSDEEPGDRDEDEDNGGDEEESEGESDDEETRQPRDTASRG